MAIDEQQEGRQHLLAVDVPQKYIGPKMAVKNLNRQTDKGELILSGVSIEVTEGTVVGIIGPSGSGKSTLLRALNRLWEPPSDSVFLDGEDVTKLNVISVRRRVGMLFQTPTLFDGTVADNIRYGPGLQGKKLNDGEVEEFLRQADLEPFFAQKSVIGLSVGQAQRVALARTLANAPEVLLLDEPTSALDPVSTQHIENSIHNLCKRRGLTVVIVSHSIKQIQKIADIVYLLVKGEVVEMLKPTELSKATHPLALEFLEAS
ncbi:hypothetical protein O6H91_03G075400 [Diphasiastrum complanatum]|uniref:Uncharacterized protein n=1 Tax=Diphasiastrum complanatum TaxID=34168 RepID=A0ACC2E899_DIPCM|nr:hypothetical protein O6H91_03G075400 [Diphasiastrum complanatum]